LTGDPSIDADLANPLDVTGSRAECHSVQGVDDLLVGGEIPAGL
jgi:hypothetical protein